MNGLSIKRVRLTNVKAFGTLDVDFGHNATSVLITGDNGNGKSTLMRAIALGLSDEMGAYGLMSELSGSIVKYKEKKASIEIYLGYSKDPTKEYKAKTEIKILDKYGTEGLTQQYQQKNKDGRYVNIEANDFPLYDLFCTAYGTSCRTFGKERYHQYYHADSVYQLFKNDSSLTEQELSLRRILDYKSEGARSVKVLRNTRFKKIFELLSDMVNLPAGWEIEHKDTGIYFVNSNVRNHKGEIEKTELSAMGDGVRAITTILLDMISWWHLYLDEIPNLEEGYEQLNRKVLGTDFKNYHGIIIIDEIEIHLHPKWRKEIISDLVSNFPNIQFIFTTHSAMCVSGATDIVESKQLKFIRVTPDKAYDLNLLPGTTANEILRTEAFGLSSTTSKKYEEKMDLLDQKILESASVSGSSNNLSKAFLKELREKNPNQRNFENMMKEHVNFVQDLKDKSD